MTDAHILVLLIDDEAARAEASREELRIASGGLSKRNGSGHLLRGFKQRASLPMSIVSGRVTHSIPKCGTRSGVASKNTGRG